MIFGKHKRRGASKGYAGSSEPNGGQANIGQYAWYSANSGRIPRCGGWPEESERADSVGMSGNVWEFCWDWYGSYPSGSQTDPTGATSGTNRVDRGGSWANSSGGLTLAFRGNLSPNTELLFRIPCCLPLERCSDRLGRLAGRWEIPRATPTSYTLPPARRRCEWSPVSSNSPEPGNLGTIGRC